MRLFILSGQSNMAKLDETATFIPAIEKAFPESENVYVKVAKGGEPIRSWLAEWKDAEGKGYAPGKNGQFFTQIQERSKNKLKDLPAPKSVAFVWMQGEADAKEHGAVYERSLNDLLALLQKEFGREDVVFVLGRLNNFKKKAERKDWETVRQAQVAFADSRELSDWVDLDEFAGRGLHYREEAYRELGQRFADKTILLLQKNEK
ncbi:MAG: sialate O-acetylesterase [Verrucomicrobiota bacterium]